MIRKDGYKIVCADGRKYLEHRVIWEEANGPIPEGLEVDHINGEVGDNRLENLRLVTHAENMMNKQCPKNNSTGVMGVRWHKTNKKYVVEIQVNRKRINVGSFACFDEAVAARKAAEKQYGFHENHGRVRK